MGTGPGGLMPSFPSFHLEAPHLPFPPVSLSMALPDTPSLLGAS